MNCYYLLLFISLIIGMYDKYDGMILPPALSISHPSISSVVGSFLNFLGISKGGEHKGLPKLAIAQKRCLELYLEDYRELLFDLNMERVSCHEIIYEILHIFYELKNIKLCANDRHYQAWNNSLDKFDEVSTAY